MEENKKKADITEKTAEKIAEKTDTLDRDKSSYMRMLLASLPRQLEVFCSETTFNLRNPFVVMGVVGEILFEVENELRSIEKLGAYYKKQVIEPRKWDA